MKLRDGPKVLFQRVVLTFLLGIGCFIVGVAYFIYSQDRITLILSLLLLAFSVIKGISVYRLVTAQKYEVVEGTCVAISSKPFTKQISVKIIDNTGNELALRLGKQTKIKIGFRYRFFFSKTERMSLGSDYLDSALSTQNFLGSEELGEYKSPSTENKKNEK